MQMYYTYVLKIVQCTYSLDLTSCHYTFSSPRLRRHSTEADTRVWWSHRYRRPQIPCDTQIPNACHESRYCSITTNILLGCRLFDMQYNISIFQREHVDMDWVRLTLCMTFCIDLKIPPNICVFQKCHVAVSATIMRGDTASTNQ